MTRSATRASVHRLGRIAGGSLRRRLRSNPKDNQPPLPLGGFDLHRSSVPYLELLDDATLEELNALLPWACYTVDSRGRRFGDRMGIKQKRETPQPVPDPRIVAMHERFDLSAKHVLEVGCFEGVHTIGLCQMGARVTAVDLRVSNVVKTIVRCAFYDQHPTVFLCDLETWEDDAALACDFVYHVGVLYHLRDPVTHLLRLGKIARHGLLLDTHVARGGEANEELVVAGTSYRYMRYEEPQGPQFVTAGGYDHAKWLLLDDLLELLHEAGFDDTNVIDERDERNGRRVTLLAGRTAG